MPLIKTEMRRRMNSQVSLSFVIEVHVSCHVVIFVTQYLLYYFSLVVVVVCSVFVLFQTDAVAHGFP